MTRSEIIKKLISEGFSEKTLVNFSDKQLDKLSGKLFGEGLKVKADDLKSDPALADKLKDMEDVTVVPEEDGKEDLDSKEIKKTKMMKGDKKLKPKGVNLKKLNEFVEKVVDEKYHNLTTKGEISELIKEKFSNLSEKESMKKLPEFIGEFEMGQPDVKPDVKPAPTKPDTDRPRREKPRHPGQRPLDPNKEPLPNPVPKAKAKEIGGEEAKSRVIKMINKIFSDN
jgi:hypothetical protein